MRSLWAQFQCMQLLRRHRFRRRTQHHVNHFSQKLLQNRLVLIVGEALYALGFSAEYAFVRVGRTVCRGVSGALLWVRSLLHTIVSPFTHTKITLAFSLYSSAVQACIGRK